MPKKGGAPSASGRSAAGGSNTTKSSASKDKKQLSAPPSVRKELFDPEHNLANGICGMELCGESISPGARYSKRSIKQKRKHIVLDKGNAPKHVISSVFFELFCDLGKFEQ